MLGHLKYRCPQNTDTVTINQLLLESEDNRRSHCGNDDDNIYSIFAVESRNDGVLATEIRRQDIVSSKTTRETPSRLILKKRWRYCGRHHRITIGPDLPIPR